MLGGPILARQGSREAVVGSGEAVVSMDMRATTERTLTNGTDVLAFAWRAGSSFGPRAPGDGVIGLSLAQRGALSRLAEAITSHDTSSAVAHVGDAVAALRAAGVPLAFEMSDRLSVPFAVREVGRALERVFCPLSSRPMAIDLARELGVCERQALRRTNALFETYYASGSTWREYVHAMRVGLSSFFMSHPRARTQNISRLLGFSSPTSFCHALHEAGLPSPLELQRALLAA
jgi:AraC-like DNA-binding protein